MQTETTAIQPINSNAKTIHKPILIICILGFAGASLMAIGLIFGWSGLAAVAPLFLAYYVAAVAATFVALIWMGQMKKKGPYLYAGLFVLSQAVMAFYGV